MLPSLALLIGPLLTTSISLSGSTSPVSHSLAATIIHNKIVPSSDLYKKGLIIMKDTFDDIERQVSQFCNAQRALDLIYEDYAKAVHMPYTSLRILNLIAREEVRTQKAICEHTFLPKQTVNSIITGFYRKGLVEGKHRRIAERNHPSHRGRSSLFRRNNPSYS